MKRRAFVELAAGALAASTFSSMPARADDWDDGVRSYIEDVGSVSSLGPEMPDANSELWTIAKQFLDDAPTGVPPFRVAEYFDRAVPEEFQRAWTDIQLANPLVASFFIATSTRPVGDTIPWCGAFLSWCLNRAGLPVPKQGAASQSFAKWGNEAWKKGDARPGAAQIGDVAVFRNQQNPTRGHVAFYMGEDSANVKRIMMLGGNQLIKEAGKTVHLISQVPKGVAGELELIGIRTMAGLRM